MAIRAANAGPAPADAAAGGDGASGIYGAWRQPPRLRGLRLSGSYDGGAGFSGAGGGGGKLSRSGHRHAITEQEFFLGLYAPNYEAFHQFYYRIR